MPPPKCCPCCRQVIVDHLTACTGYYHLKIPSTMTSDHTWYLLIRRKPEYVEAGKNLLAEARAWEQRTVVHHQTIMVLYAS